MSGSFRYCSGLGKEGKEGAKNTSISDEVKVVQVLTHAMCD